VRELRPLSRRQLHLLYLMKMLNKLFLSVKRTQRRFVYILLSVITAMGLVVGTPQPSHSFSLWELLFRGVQIFQISNLSDSQEVKLGKQINEQLIDRGQFRLYPNQQVNEYIDQIGQRLVPHSDRSDIPYTFQVVSDENINAFATMGGYVYVTTGLIKAADNEAQLASVIAHEIAHISERHAVEQMRQQAIQQGLLSAAGLDQSTAVRIGVELAIQRPNSRQDELDADSEGLETLSEAGYAPIAFANFLEKLQGRSGVPAFLSTHPSPDNRIDRVEETVAATNGNVGDGLNEQAYRQNIRPLL
jgi:predicted Zn-dependent protease